MKSALVSLSAAALTLGLASAAGLKCGSNNCDRAVRAHSFPERANSLDCANFFAATEALAAVPTYAVDKCHRNIRAYAKACSCIGISDGGGGFTTVPTQPTDTTTPTEPTDATSSTGPTDTTSSTGPTDTTSSTGPTDTTTITPTDGTTATSTDGTCPSAITTQLRVIEVDGGNDDESVVPLTIMIDGGLPVIRIPGHVSTVTVDAVLTTMLTIANGNEVTTIALTVPGQPSTIRLNFGGNAVTETDTFTVTAGGTVSTETDTVTTTAEGTASTETDTVTTTADATITEIDITTATGIGSITTETDTVTSTADGTVSTETDTVTSTITTSDAASPTQAPTTLFYLQRQGDPNGYLAFQTNVGLVGGVKAVATQFAIDTSNRLFIPATATTAALFMAVLPGGVIDFLPVVTAAESPSCVNNQDILTCAEGSADTFADCAMLEELVQTVTTPCVVNTLVIVPVV